MTEIVVDQERVKALDLEILGVMKERGQVRRKWRRASGNQRQELKHVVSRLSEKINKMERELALTRAGLR